MKALVFLVFVMVLSGLLFLTQVSVDKLTTQYGEVAPELYNYEGSTLAQFDAGNYTVVENVSDALPQGEGQVEADSGNIFTDTFITIRNWVSETTGFKYLGMIVGAVPNFLESLGLPKEVSFMLGALFNSVAMLILIAFILGRT